MATIGQNNLTLSDWKGRIDPSGKLDTIIEAAANVNHIMQDMLYIEGNQSEGNKATIRTGYPAGTWRMLYGGVPEEKSSTKQVVDAVGILEAYSTVDAHLTEISPDPVGFRMGEDASFLEGMMQTLETKFFYGNQATDPEEITGLAPRYGTLTADATSLNVIDGGGSGSDQTSIWLVTWHPQTCFTFFGKGTKAGFQVTDKGMQTVYDTNNDPFEAWRTHFKWQIGVALPDWRYCARLCNVDSVDRDAGTVAFRTNLIKLLNKRPNIKGRSVIYMNRATQTALEIEMTDIGTTESGRALRYGEWLGVPTMFLRDVPIRIADAITDAEAEVT